jgi:hypothetical protein
VSCATIDPIITEWAQRNSLFLYTSWPGGEIRITHLSSVAGDCYRISVGEPVEDLVSVQVVCIEGSREIDLPRIWTSSIADLGSTLEQVLTTVVDWMAPSVRYFPG